MRDILEKAISELEAASCETPRLDAEVLLAHALGCDRSDLYKSDTWYQVPGVKLERFHTYVHRRKRREPVAYITGTREFWSIPINVTPDVLIPRPETEAVVEAVLETLQKNLATDDSRLTTILDLCTGSGCIAAALAKELPHAQLTVSDISAKALVVAKENLKFAGDRVTFIQSDLFQNIEGKFDLIVSNPPYVASTEWETLQPEIKNYEPRLALDGGGDGLDFIRRIRQDAPRHLKPDGWLIIENGPKIEQWKNSSLTEELPCAEASVPAAPRTLSSP